MPVEQPDKVILDIVEAYKKTLSRMGVSSNSLYGLNRKSMPVIKAGQPLHLFLDHAAEAAGIANSLRIHIEEMKQDAEKDKFRGLPVHQNTAHLLTYLRPLLDRAKVMRNRAVEASIEAYRHERRKRPRRN